MKLKIVSTGEPFMTKIINAETGEALEGVLWARWELAEGDDFATVTLALEGVAVDVVGNLVGFGGGDAS